MPNQDHRAPPVHTQLRAGLETAASHGGHGAVESEVAKEAQ